MNSPVTEPLSPLQLAVDRYDKAISTLEATEEVTIEQVLEVLVARDAIHEMLASRESPVSAWTITAVHKLDDRLRQQSKRISQFVRLADWQAVFDPPKKDWWWSTPPQWNDRLDWLWELLTLGFLAASIAILVEISTRFFSGSPDLAGIFAIVTPSILTLLAGGSFTRGGRELIQRILSSFGAPKRWWDEATCIFSALILLLSALFFLSLPKIADHYEAVGDRACSQGGSIEQVRCEFDIAEQNYQRSLKLEPKQPEVHFKLARLYESSRKYPKAITAYEAAKESGYDALAFKVISGVIPQQNVSSSVYETYIRLAYLYNVRGEARKDNYSEAAALLSEISGLFLSDTEEARTPEQKRIQYFYLVTRGLTQLNQNNPVDARNDLEKAVILFQNSDDDKPEAYCLLGRTFRQLKDRTREKANWEQCIRYVNQDIPEQSTWYVEARQRLKDLGEQKQP